MKKMKIAALAASVVVAASAVAFAHGGATGIYKERMDAMMAMGKVVKSLATMMRGEIAYDATAVRQAAATFKSHSGQTMTALFPEGTTEMPSEARLEIWQEWETFNALADQLHTYAEGLEKAADNGLAMSGTASASMMDGKSTMMGSDSTMMGTDTTMMGGTPAMMSSEELAGMPADGVFNMITKTCSSCHTKFRMEKK